MELVPSTDGKSYQLIVHEKPKPTRATILADRELFRAVREVAKHIQGFALDRKTRVRFFNNAHIARLFNETIQEKLGAEPAFHVDRWFTDAVETERAAVRAAASAATEDADSARTQREKDLSEMLSAKIKVDPNDAKAVAAAEKRRKDLAALSTMMAEREEDLTSGSKMNQPFATHDWFAELVNIEVQCAGGFVGALRNSIEADGEIDTGPSHSQLVRHIETYGAVHDRKLPLASFGSQ